jgi:hypothetical protein
MRKLMTAAGLAMVISVFVVMSVAFAAPPDASVEFEHPGKYEKCAFTNPDNLALLGIEVSDAQLEFWTRECADVIGGGAMERPPVAPFEFTEA